MIVPDEALPILRAIAPAFTRPTFRRSALLGNGRRTVADAMPGLKTLRRTLAIGGRASAGP